MLFRSGLPLLMDAAWRLGPRPVMQAAWHRSPFGRALLRRALREPPAPPAAGPAWPATAAAAAPAGLSPAATAALLARAALVRPRPWHGPFPPGSPASGQDLFGPGDIRPVWEASRWAELPLLAQAQRLQPAAGHDARAALLLADWARHNPAFRGPNWACGQEAALRALHFCLALALLGAAPPPAARALLALHARRVAAAPGYAEAQDNNHPLSEAAGLLGLGLVLGDATLARRGAARLNRHVLRLVGADGAFAQASTGYHRLLLDVVAVAEWLARHHGAPGLAEPARHRMAAATDLLWRLTDPTTGATPRLGHQDGSAFADLALAGPDDARPSLERAARLFCGRGGGLAAEPGCAWLGLQPQAAGGFIRAPRWRAAGLEGWSAAGARGVLRVGPLRFRPGHADLLHFDLHDHLGNLLRDGGTGAYNPGPGQHWWLAALAGTAGHNTISFDDTDQMPRLSRFLFARWPACGRLAEGGWLADARGNRQERRVTVLGDEWQVADQVSGGFATAALRWRLAPGDWRLTANGVASPRARLSLSADAPLEVTLEAGWESPAYGQVVAAPVLVARSRAPVSRFLTIITLFRPPLVEIADVPAHPGGR